MKMNKSCRLWPCGAGTALAMLLAVGGSTNVKAQVVAPVSVTASSYYSAAQNPANLINGNGLLGTGDVLTRTHGNDGSANGMWHSSGGSVAASWLIFDLGTSYTLTAADIWQMNQPCCLGRGVKTFGIFTSPNLTDPITNYVGLFALNQGSGTTNEHAQHLAFLATGARRVLFAITNDWNGSANDYVGLSEVRFEGSAPPAIVTQPQSTTAFQGDAVTTFTVTVVGAPTPTYQWFKNSTILLPGATNLTLTLTNLQVADAGTYSLTASNSAGSATSSNALLTVLNPPLDTTGNLLTHLKFDETTGLTAADSTTNGNNGALQGFPGDDTQWVPQGRINGAIRFLPASSGYQTVVLVPDAAGMFDFSTKLTFTLSAWFRGSGTQVDSAGILCKGFGAGGEQYCFDVYQGKFRFYCRDAAGTGATVLNTPSQLNNTWQHVVVVFNRPFNRLKFYLNGTEVASTTPPASLYSTTHDVSIGSRELSPTGATGYDLPLAGDIDDVRIYDRALSPTDVLALYDEAPLPVSFVQPPQSANLFVGETLRLTPAVDGTQPITWQWLKNGTNLPGASANYLTITNVQTSDAGNYRLVAANAANTVTSAVAVVTVTAATSVTNGLAGYWKFDETSGTTAADSSGLGNQGTTMNIAGDNSQWVAGKIGGAMKFSGPTALSEYVLVPTWPKALNGTMSFSAWVWADARPDRARIACGGSGVDGIGQFLLTQSTTTSDLRGYVETSGRATVSAQEGALFPTNSWQHVAMVADGTTLLIYRNGVLVATNAYDGTLFDPTNALSLGARLDTTDSVVESGAWEGKMDDMAYWTRGLSPSQVFELFAAGSAGQPVTSADAYSHSPPIITSQPLSVSLYLHDAFSLQVTAASLTAPTYQWWQDGTPIANATNRVFTNPRAEFSAAGSYVVVVTGNGLSVTSAPVSITLSAPTPQPDAGLVLHLKLDELTGGVASDSTTNANYGTLVNFLNPNTNWVPGAINGALLFSQGAPTADAVAVPPQPYLDFGANPFSLALWAKGPGGQTDSGGLLCKGISPGESYCIDFRGGSYRFFVRNSLGQNVANLAIQSGISPNNQWQHLAVTYDPGVSQSRMYVNGVLVGTAVTAEGLFSNVDTLDLGARQGAAGYAYNWTGALDDVRVYDRAITSLEVRALTYQGLPPTLAIAASNGQVTVSWPLEAVSYELQSSGSLATGLWNNVPGVTTNSLTLTPISLPQFYRLHRQ